MVAAAEDPPQPDYTTWPALELIRNEIVTDRLEVIAVANIDLEASIIDESHADDLAHSMAGRRGQTTPIVVRARESTEVPGRIVYDVIDGFHRTNGKKRRGESTIKANVLYAVDDEEMYDHRILAASSVRQVQFPRVVEWIKKSYEASEWYSRGLTVVQAFQLAVNDSKRSNIASFTREEVARLKQWAKDKSEKWDRSVSSTFNMLRLVEDADPDLVRQVRSQGGGKDRHGVITPGRLKAVVEAFGGEEYFGAQRGILRIVVDNRLTEKETIVLAASLDEDVMPGIDEEEAAKLAEQKIIPFKLKKQTQIEVEEDDGGEEDRELRDPDAEELMYEEGDEPEVEFEDEEPDAAALGRLEAEEEGIRIDAGAGIVDPIRLARGTAQAPDDIYIAPPRPTSATGRLNPAATAASNGNTPRPITSTGSGNNRPTNVVQRDKSFTKGELDDPVDMRKRIEDLEKALVTARSSSASADVREAFWRTAEYLTIQERRIMIAVMDEEESIAEVAVREKTTSNQIIGLMQSAYAKRSLKRDVA